MHRLTARSLLVLLLVGSIAPAALAIAAPTPHACCMRKPMHMGSTHDSEFHASATCCQHDCCRALTVSHWADLAPLASGPRSAIAASLQGPHKLLDVASPINGTHSGR